MSANSRNPSEELLRLRVAVAIATFLLLDVSIYTVMGWAILTYWLQFTAHACIALLDNGWSTGLPVAIALWVVWRRGKWLPRLGVGFALLVVVQVAEFFVGREHEFRFLFNPFTVQWTLLLVAVAILLPIRDWTGWRLQSVDEAPPRRQAISLLLLFQWMTVLAGALAMWRAAYEIVQYFDIGLPRLSVEYILPRCILTLPPTCAAFYAVLATQSSAVRRCAAFGGLPISYLYYILGYYRLGEDAGYWPAVVEQLSLTMASIVYAVLLRIAGLRLLPPTPPRMTVSERAL